MAKGDPEKFVDVQPTEASEKAREKLDKIRAEQRKKTFEAITKPFKDLFSEAPQAAGVRVAQADAAGPTLLESLFKLPAGEKAAEGGGTQLQSTRDAALKSAGFGILRDYFADNPDKDPKEEDVE